MKYTEMSREQLQTELAHHKAEYAAHQSRGLKINATRGKPNAEQLALADALLTLPSTHIASDSTDVRNYGGADGLPEMKQLFADLLGVTPQEVIVGGNASLNMMFDCIATLILSGVWQRGQKFLCPAPGYDRHFAICEYFGLEMLTIPMTPDGPDMDIAERLAADPNVVGMWCVPVFSNPQGYTYSDETIRRLAAMPVANAAFALLWDNAYAIHHFKGVRPQPLNILRECERVGNACRPIIFTSFSKISYAGSGVVAMASCVENLNFFRKRINVQTIGPDKINQLRHVEFFRDVAGIQAHMDKHAAILRPKFERAYTLLSERLTQTNAEWTTPDGGYFLSVEVPGCAKRIYALCREAGLEITEAGAAYPYGKDPLDANLRFGPSFLRQDEIDPAMDVLCSAINVAAIEQVLG